MSEADASTGEPGAPSVWVHLLEAPEECLATLSNLLYIEKESFHALNEILEKGVWTDLQRVR